MHGRVIYLINLVAREVRCINVGLEFGLERRPDLSEGVPNYTAEERVSADFGTATYPRCRAEAIGGISQKTGGVY